VRNSLYLKSEKWEKVVHYCQAIITHKPDAFKAYMNLAKALKEQGNAGEAIAAYKKAIELQPHRSPRPYLELGDLLEEQNHLEEQITIYCQAIKFHPEKLNLNKKLATTLLQKGKIETLAKNGQLSETIAFYQDLQQLPSFLECSDGALDRLHSRLGEIILQQSIKSGDFTQSVSFFKESCTVKPDTSWYFYGLGQCLDQQNKPIKSLKNYRKAIELNPEIADFCIGLGRVLTKRKSWNEALEWYLKALQLHPKNHRVYKFIFAYFEEITIHCTPDLVQGQVQAYQDTVETIELPPGSYSTYARMGKVLSRCGHLSEAIQINTKATQDVIHQLIPDHLNESFDLTQLQKPSFFIFGVMKCGTTALYDYMTQHPQILPSIIKEPNQDGLAGGLGSLDEKLSYYLSFFPPLPETGNFRTGEASTVYINSLEVPAIILKHFSQAKLIAILRNPVKRFISQYFFQLKGSKPKKQSLENLVNSELELLEGKNDFSENLEQYIESSKYLLRGMYVYFLEKWMSVFPREQFLILRNEDLSRDPSSVMTQVFNFLELPDYQQIQYPPRNKGSYPAKIDESLINRLSEFYRPHNQRLEEFLDRKFDWD
jgi:tetratricopeptide (TPR) repeat protein